MRLKRLWQVHKMDFYQIMALAGLIVAILIGGMEVPQLYIQRKILKESRDVMKQVRDKLETIDVSEALRDGRAATQALQDALTQQIAPLRDKVLAIDLDKMAADMGKNVQTGIKEYGASIDTGQLIEALASEIVEQARASIPEMVADARKQAQVEGAQLVGLDPKQVAFYEKHPLGALLSMAMQRRAALSAAPMPQQVVDTGWH